ncbi:ERF family protein [Brevibacillus laterosporus]|uniref:ERF family protein n=1 Tax=Brevibacillus laterosporus TaxID=1465 RepID=A0AAP3GBH6_BRELA|nr:ERF family protein [Brevibacillus laterosporus]MCR8980927.1 ERF family protein [Brevibacillus laterosporus]MCZ0808082.1 ERF family protein [Brevibacillus laterosporus]MCZ0826274.1 ERF family protein [Brevibacillus laterosporus]MCZ0850157.1 ERF family protein [Brevibacillus laterosporus]
MSVYKKILAVMNDVSYLQKDDQVEFKSTKYKTISEEKVTSAVGKAMRQHGLVIIPVHQEHSKVDQLTTVNVRYQIVDVDTGDSIEAVSSGTGVDTQDKGVGKAMTYAYKYLLLRTFAIPTGEDPDKVSSAELDEKPKAQPNVSNSKEATLKAKWQLLAGSLNGFDDWYQKKRSDDHTDQDIEQFLTEKLKEKGVQQSA